ncbi:hypothetical protein [Roseateles sp. L2-2]|uniref:hypothetical protein n=1 Tax=Roseateles sp. L2-2 TaxID=3422597 RepID=UPI003D35ACCC
MRSVFAKLSVSLAVWALLLCPTLLLAQTASSHADASGLESLREELNSVAFEVREVSSDQLKSIEERFDIFSDRGLVLPSDWRMLLHLELRTWRFSRVEMYRQSKRIPAQLLEGITLPKNSVAANGDGFPFWTLDFKKNELRQATVAPAEDPTLVVVFHPLCGVCKRLTADIATDPVLASFMHECSFWAGTVEGNFSNEVFERWATTHDTLALRFVRDWADLGSFATFETPTFRVLRRGKVTDELVGWPREGSSKRLSAFLEKNGMSFATHCRSGEVARTPTGMLD